MSLQDELLIQARMLATVDAGVRPQANLRRAVSAAYYALFHLFIAESVALLVPSSPSDLRARVARSFVHSEMNRVCGIFARPQMSDELRALLPQGATRELRAIAATFCQLQQQRHRADYDITFVTDQAIALLRVEEAERAFELWNTLGATDEKAVFLTALAFPSRWSK